MSYGKVELEEAVNAILGINPVIALGLPRAVEESAIQLFLNPDAHADALTIIRSALSDLRDFGSFKFAK